jgi:hypothetical protein
MLSQVTPVVEVFFSFAKDAPPSSLQQNIRQGTIRTLRTVCSLMYELLPVVSIQDSMLSSLYPVPMFL